jgi:uncharacterized protein YxjI
MYMNALMQSRFSQKQYIIRRPFLTLFGRTFHVFGADGQQVLFVRHKIFSLKDEWSIFSDDSEQTPLLKVKARSIIGLDRVTDVFDADTGDKVGSVKMAGLKSLFKDSWQTLGSDDQPNGQFSEGSSAFLRRLFPFLLGRWQLEMGGAVVARLQQDWKWFTKQFTLDVSGAAGKVDTRLVLAVSLLALMREIARERQ